MIRKSPIVKEAEMIVENYKKRYESEFGVLNTGKKKKSAPYFWTLMIFSLLFLFLIFMFFNL